MSFVHVTQLSGLLAQARAYPGGVARADLVETLTMGRNAVDRRLRTALDLDLLEPAGRGMSTGGRAPELWRFNPRSGTVLALSIAYRSSTAALMTLDGAVVERRDWAAGLLNPPQDVAAQALVHLQELRGARPDLPAPWGVGVSIPMPVDFRDGSVVDPVAGSDQTPVWTTFQVRPWLMERLGLSVWMDDEVNAMALAAATRVGAPKDLLYIRLSLGLGMGIVSSGTVHRGAGASSGEIAHIQVGSSQGIVCRCARRGCLETLTSGAAMEKAASTAQALAASAHLRAAKDERGRVLIEDVLHGAAAGDRVCRRIVTEATDRIAGVLAVVTTTYNPGEIVLGGQSAIAGELVSATFNQAIRRRVLPVTSQRLRVRAGHVDDALTGICALAVERLLSPHVMATWLPLGSPDRCPELATHRRQDA